MGTIHINTDTLRQLGQLYVRLNDQVTNQIQPSIQSNSSQLENDWQGVSRQRYDQMYGDWKTHVQQAVTIGEDLGRHLEQTATNFENADQS